MKRALPLLICLQLLSPFAAGAPPLDQGDDEYRYLVGLVEKELYDLAIGEATDFLREHPDHPKAELARYRLATALFEFGRIEEAAPHYARLGARDGFEYRAESLFRSGQCELADGKLVKARKAFDAVLASDQDYLHAPATFFLGEALFQAGDFAAAETRYAELLRLHGQSEYARDAERSLAWCAWESDRPEEAVARIGRFLKTHGGPGEEPEMRVLLGEALLELGRPGEAAEAYGAIRSGEFHAAALRGVGFALGARGDAAGAADSFTQILEAYPESPLADEARLQGGIQRLQAGSPRGAIALLRKAPGSEAMLWLADAQRQSGNSEAALGTLDKLARKLRSKPNSELESRLQIARGELFTQLGRSAEAVRAFESAGSEYALYAAAVAKLNDGDIATAVRLCTRILKEYRGGDYGLETRMVLGEALFQIERYGDAEKALTPLADPAHARQAEFGGRALSRLAWCRYLQDDPAGAARRFAELLKRFPGGEEAPESLFMLGRAHQDAGANAQAARAWKRYLAGNQGGEHAAQALFGLSETTGSEAAQGHLLTLIENHGESELLPRALLALADRLSEEGDRDQAIARYGELLARAGTGPLADQGRYGLGWCLFEAGEFQRAAEELERIEPQGLEPDFAGSVAELCVWCWSRVGNPDRASAAWQRMSLTVPEDDRRFQAARAVVETCKQAERPEIARRVLDELLGSLRDEAIATAVLIEVAYISLEEEDIDRAAQEIALARRGDHGNPLVTEASFYLGEALFARGDDEAAIDAYGAALEHDAVGPRALYKLGFAHLRRGTNEHAEVAFARLVREHPKSDLVGESLFLLGEACFRQGAFGRAVPPLESVRKEHRQHEVAGKALFRLGVSLAHLKRFADAESALGELAKRFATFPNLLEAELWRGRSLAAQGKERAAKQALGRVIAEDRGELAADARLALGGLHENRGRIEEALSEYLKVVVLYAHEEKVAEALYRAGGCLEQQGETEQAIRQYREVTGDHRDSAFAKPAAARLRELTRR